MPWRHTVPEDERLQFIVVALDEMACFADLCRSFRVSRKTGYKWLARYQAEGPAGLADRPRSPHTHPRQVSADVVEHILDVRKKHPRWGPRKLLAWLTRHNPSLALPAASTTSEVLKRYGLVLPRRSRHWVPSQSSPFGDCKAPNDIWAVDFKGHFRLGDGSLCYPLTITDLYSRYLLCCEAQGTTSTPSAMLVFEQVFRRYGLPKVIRSDNGVPFASVGPGGFTRLSAWWMRLGIHHERIEPGRPDQNGSHERMHLTLKLEIGRPQANRQAQQRALDLFRRTYNDERPHEAIGQNTPSSLYCPSSTPLPTKPAPLSYPASFQARHVDGRGKIGWARGQPNRIVYLGVALAGEEVGLEETTPGVWAVHFGDVVFGALDDRRPGRLITPPGSRRWGRRGRPHQRRR
jgi:putative transposase